MRTIRFTSRFKRDYKRELRGPHRTRMDAELAAVVRVLERDELLPVRYRDHALTGEWNDCRDCHLRPDLVLVYRLLEPNDLELVRLGSHAELGL